VVFVGPVMPDHEANYGREKRGCDLLSDELSGLKGFYLPNRAEKLKIIELLGISKGFVATFDAIRFKPPVGKFAEITSAQHFDLLEMKVTDKYLPNFPGGFFFGMTENEEMLLKVFKGKYFLCLVSLNPQNPQHCLVDWDGLKGLVQNKRVQYQINLARR
jgi:hypothetical protein